MGILTRQQGESYVITSDRRSATAPSKRAPARPSDVYEVWTGASWSESRGDALSFTSLEAADEYVRANFAKVIS